MDTPAALSHRQKLAPVLRRLRQRIRRLQSLRGGARVATLMLGGLLALAAADYFFAPISTVIRWLMPVVWIGAVVWGATEWLIKPLAKKLNFVRLARWLETRHPELEERVSTVLELEKHPNAAISSSLLDDLAETAAVDLKTIDPQTEIAGRRARRWMWPAMALLLAWAILFTVWPSLASRHVVRALVPNSSYGTAGGLIVVLPGDLEVIEGDAVDITARRVDGKSGESLEIVIELPDGSEMVETMQPGDEGHGFHLGKADRSFSYVVRTAGVTSDRHLVTVRPAPRLIDPRARLEFPAYTQRKVQESGLGNAGLRAIAGTRVEIVASLNTAIASAMFSLNGENAGDVRVERAADGGKLVISFDLADTGTDEAVLSLMHPLGREFEVLRFPVETVPDEVPTVTWIAPTQDEMKLRPDDVFAFRYESGDDVGLERVEFEVKAGSGDQGRLPLSLPDRYGVGEPLVWRGGGEQAIGALRDRWPSTRKYEVRVRVEDSRPVELGGPGVGVSEWKTIKIDDGADSLAKQELQAQHSDARETIQEAKRDIQQAKQKLNQPHSKPLDEQDKKELAEARKQLSEAQQKLAELAERMREGVHEAQRDEVEKAAQELSEAVQHTEEASLQDDPEAQKDELELAQDAAEAAAEQLQKLQEQIQKLQPQINDLARLKEFEQEQRELARQAAVEAQKPTDPQNAAAQQPDEQWRQQQERLAEKLRQETAQRPEARVAALEQQAEAAQDLAERAEQAAVDQEKLENLAEQIAQAGEQSQDQSGEQSGEQSGSPEQQESAEGARETLREALAERQKELSGELVEKLTEARENRDASANVLPEAAAAAQEAAESLAQAGEQSGEQSGEKSGEQSGEQSGTQQAAEQAAQAAEALAEAAGEASEASDAGGESGGEASEAGVGEAARSEELTNLAEQQEQLAEAIEAFAQGEDAAALEQLAAMEAAQAGELAADIASEPGLTSSSQPMKEAARAAESGAQKAGEAAESAGSGQAQAAASQHEAAAGKMSEAAAALEQAASQFSAQAASTAAAARGQARSGKAPIPGEAMAEAFREASQAGDAQSSAEAADHAEAAAQALSQGAQAAMRAMQGRRPSPPGQPGQPNPMTNQPGQPGEPALDPQDQLPTPEPDQGVPPELAKLGLSSDDWAQIQSALKAETGAGASIKVPEEYRGLVRSYFEQMAKGGGK